MKKTILFTFLGILISTGIFAQQEMEVPSFTLKRTHEQIQIDGRLDEKAWFAGTAAKDFWQYFPTDSVRAEQKTEIWMCYDDANLYIAAKCYAQGNDYVIPSLKRDYRAGGSDNITFLIDPFGDRTNAFVFGINPYGVLREALISNGGAQIRRDWDDSWDAKWRGKAKIYEGYWIGEMAIPLKSIRFQEGSQNWRFNSYRFDTQGNENSSWVRIPRNQWIINLAFMGNMIWEEPLKKQRTSISVIPYLAGSTLQDFEEKQTRPDFNWNAGADAKVSITSGLNLDLTFNPDFSQVEVDRQVTNLSRFELFFPERRQFFLEKSDLFGSFGDSRQNPFLSRIIWIAKDTVTDDNIENTILYGARLSGKLNKDWRVGFLNMQTAKDSAQGLPSFNYTVASLQRRLFSRSNVSFIMVNKQAFGEKDDELFDGYNRVVGVDYNLASSDNRWTGKVFYHHSFTENGTQNNPFSHGTSLRYNTRKYIVEWTHQLVGEGFDAQVGFVPRSDFFRINPEVRMQFYPQDKRLTLHSVNLSSTVFWNNEFGKTDHEVRLSWNGSYIDNSRLNISLTNEYTFLTDSFDPSRTDSEELPANTDYTYTSLRLSYNSDRRKKFSYRIQPRAGQFFNGWRYGVSGELTYRYQPLGFISINYNYNYINLPDPYATASLFLIGPRIDLTFTKNIFLTTFLQFNSQIDNLNINTRFQWRFAPVSDFFLVYTDNYLTENFSIRNRAIVAKLTYWLNI
ncbi:MAG: DUF5916 domain-containing protein [Bacteroidota bacterium]